MALASGDWDGFVEHLSNSVGALFKGIIEATIQFFVDAGKLFADKFNELIKNILNFPWVQTGRDLIGGIITGIRSAIGAAVAAATDVAHAILNAIASVLGIGSDSKVMIEYGKFLMSGLATGTKQALPIAEASIVGATADVVGAVTNTYYTTRNIAGGSTINVTIQAGALLSFADENALESKLKPLLIQWGFAQVMP
jgi:hypothetical protein